MDEATNDGEQEKKEDGDKKRNIVLSASSKCAGGVEPSGCKHAFAVLSQEYCMKELHNDPTEVLQTWHAPSKKKKFEPKKNEDLFPTIKKPVTVTSVNFDALRLLPKDAPIFSVLNDERFNYIDFVYEKSIPLPAVVLVDKLCTNLNLPQSLNREEIFFFHEKIQKNVAESYEIERRTMMQNNDFFQKQKFLRLTPSNFRRICHSTDFDKTSYALLNLEDLSHIPEVSHGKLSERKAKSIITTLYPLYDFRQVGLVINPLYSYLGASPDGLLCGEKTMVVEIKCIYNKHKKSLEELSKNPNFCLMNNNGSFSLKTAHKYYYQVQGQMAITNLDTCLFAVFYDPKIPPFIQEIKFNKTMWEGMLKQLKYFYFNVHLKNVIKCQSAS